MPRLRMWPGVAFMAFVMIAEYLTGVVACWMLGHEQDEYDFPILGM